MSQLTNFGTQLLKTVNDDDEVEDFSEESDVEVEFQPSKQKSKKQVDFDSEFQFASSVNELNTDIWNDLSKYVKRKAKSKTDDKIKKVRAQKEVDKEVDETKTEVENDNLENSDISLSDDELVHDNINTKEKKKKKNKNVEEESQFFEDINSYEENATFYQMNLSRPLLKAIVQMNFIHPTPIQAATIPVALLGRDICGCAATGTGKTAAYMLPTLERLLFRPSDGTAVTRVLVLVPTRELGVQVYQVTKQLCQFTNVEVGLAVGGLDLKTQESVLRKSPDVVIATPGRLIDHLQSTPSFSLDSIEVLILDEADRMLDEYFAEQMKQIIKQCSRTRQTMLFSATMTEEVNDLASVSLTKPARVFVDSNKEVAFNLRQEFIRIRPNREIDREPILAALVCRTFRDHCMIFVQTKKQAHRLHILLGLLGLQVVELHGNLTQPQRLEALQKFKNEEADILVATDVAARGLDISGVQTVINFVMPATLEHYIHRVGRTARAGRAGVSVSLAGEQERKIVKEVVKRAKNPVKSRVIPVEIIEKYNKKIAQIDPEIERILQEEYEERQLSKAENQFNRAKKILDGEASERRPWFQNPKERKKEKERLTLKSQPAETVTKNKKVKGDKIDKPMDKKKVGHKKKGKETAEDRINSEVHKVALLQARLAKRKAKPKKINSCVEINREQLKTGQKRKKSNFTGDFCDVSNVNAKKLRYDANVKQKQNKQGKGKFAAKNQGGKRKFASKNQGGKVFGKPQQKKNKK